MLIKTFDKRLFLFLSFVFVIATITGTLSHEWGHYIIAKKKGYMATIHFGSTSYWDTSGVTDSITAITTRNREAVLSDQYFPEKERYDQLVHSYSRDRFWISCGGPLQTMLTGTFGLILLFLFKRYFKNRQKLEWWQWTLIFLSLFWLRQTANMVMWFWDYLFANHFSRLDEVSIARYLDLPFWSLTIITGLIGAIILYIVLLFIPKNQRLTFICAGIAGGVAGFIIWLMTLGRAVLP